jgi:YD repeat-containing protein
LTETDILSRITSYTYDRNGKVASTTNALGQTYNYVYAGGRTTIIYPLGRKTTSVSNHYVNHITSANVTIVNYSRDAEGRILQQTEKANATAIGLIPIRFRSRNLAAPEVLD